MTEGWTEPRPKRLGPHDDNRSDSEPADDMQGEPLVCSTDSGAKCSHEFTYDERRAERFCERCGLVVERRIVATESTSTEEQTGFIRRNLWSWPELGGARTRLASERLDGKGRKLNASVRRRFRRLAQVEWRHRPSRHRERTTSKAVAFLMYASQSTGLPKAHTLEAISLYRRAAQQGLITGRSSQAFAAASLLAVSRSTRQPRGLKEISRIAGIRPRKVRKALNVLCSYLHIHRSLGDPRAFLPRFASQLSLPWSVEREAARFLAAAETRGLLCSGSPLNMAAAALVLASAGGVSEGYVSRMLGLSQSSISRWKQRILRAAVDEETSQLQS